MAYLDFFSDYASEALWLRGPGWDDFGLADSAELGVSEPLRERIAQWCEVDNGDHDHWVVDWHRHRVRALELVRLVQLELGDAHEVWLAGGADRGCPILALESGEADLVRRVGRRGERLERVPIQQLAASANTRWRIRQWRREGRALDGPPGDALWRAEGLDIAAQLQQEVGLSHFICYLGGRTEQPPVEPFRP